MAFTKAPTQDTYSSQKLPVIYDMTIEGTGTTFLSIGAGSAFSAGNFVGSYISNVIPQTRDGSKKEDRNSWYATTRPGLDITKIATAGPARGGYVWEKTSSATYYFCVSGRDIYTSIDSITWTLVSSFPGPVTVDPVGFCEFIDGTNTKSLIIVDGRDGYVFTSNAAGTLISDVDFPSPHLPYPVFIDGYLFLAKEGTGDIYNSNLNDPSSWTAGNFISSELYPDDLQALVKVNNYLLAIGKSGSEYFYDAGNATGSPLARYEGGSLPFGTQVPTSIASNKNTVALIAAATDGEMCIRVIEDFKYRDITPSWITNLLYPALTGAAGSWLVNGWFARAAGELLYILTVYSNTTPGNFVAVYHFSLGIWMFWETSFGGYTANGFPMFGFSGSVSNSATYVVGQCTGYDTVTSTSITGSYFGKLTAVGGSYDRIVDGASQALRPITSIIQTPILDFGTVNNKAMHRLTVGYSPLSSTTGDYFDSEIKVYWNDTTNWANTKNIYNVATIPVPDDWSVDEYKYNYPSVTQLGTFRRRQLRIQYTGPIKYHFIEVDINKGQQ